MAGPASRFSLRVQDREVPLPLGDFQIGRNRACHLVLEDGMVSRRHAVLHVTREQVVVEDLGSRNGIRVNGMPIAGPRPVEHGERITVGNFELLVLERVRQREDRRPTRPLPRGGQRRTPVSPFEDTDVHAKGIYDALLENAAQHLQEGQGEQLEASARNLSASVRTGLLEGHPPSPEVTRMLCQFAIRAAEKTGSGSWVEAVIHLHAAIGRMVDDDTVEGLERLKGGPSAAGQDTLRAYVDRMRERRDDLAEVERERLTRLEALLG